MSQNTPRRMLCAYCGVVKPWTTPRWVRRPNAVRFEPDGSGEFYSLSYAECWLCWERHALASAIEWARRAWLRRVGRRWA